MDSFRPETLTAIDVVARAIALAARGGDAFDITSKGGRDLVTTADVAVEDAIRELLTTALGLPVIGEERGGVPPEDGSPYWLVDPICGTRNFASRIPQYCVNLALVEAEQVTIAVVGDPATGEVYAAEQGRGAWMVQESRRLPLTASDESRIIVIEDSASKGAMREHAARFTADAIRADRWHFRSLGTSLGLPYVAAGRISAYVLFWSSTLHIGAGVLLAAEAGASVTEINGRPWTIHSDTLLVSANPRLHADLLELSRATAPRPVRLHRMGRDVADWPR